MARDRMIRGTMRESETTNAWPYDLRFFWTQLWGYCDDWGRGRRDPRIVKAGVVPIDDAATPDVVDRWMLALEAAGVLEVYVADGKEYFECTNWFEHNDLKYLTKTTIPDRSGVVPRAGKFSEMFPNYSPEVEEEKKREVEGEGASLSPFCKRHQPFGTDEPCGGCGNARRRLEAAREEQKNKVLSPPRDLPHPDTCRHTFKAGFCALCGAKEDS